MTIKNGQRKKIVLFLLLFYSLALSQSALQPEKLLCAEECKSPIQFWGTLSCWRPGTPQRRDLLLFWEFVLLFHLFDQRQHIFFL